MYLNLSFILAAVALVCGVLLFIGKQSNKYPLAAIAIILLAINQMGILR